MTFLSLPVGYRRRAGLPASAALRLWWLGQAGFLLQTADATIVIDPYLTDSLAEKYRGTHFPHRRMMAPPIAPDDLDDVDLVLSTHGHTDHLDPGTLGPLAAASPGAMFLVARSTERAAIERGVPADRMVTIDAGESWSAADGSCTINAVASAHEEIEQDDEGNHRFLGYVVDTGDLCIFHSGDCVPYDGLSEVVARFSPDIALLPINGRDAYRKERGVPGNFTAEEAVGVARAIGAGYLMGHHIGMFDFNTIDPDVAQATFDRAVGDAVSLDCIVPEMEVCYVFSKLRGIE